MLEALAHHPRLILTLGSAHAARSARNPFTARERASVIRAALRDAGIPRGRVRLTALPDRHDTPRWAEDVRAAVAGLLRPGEQPVLTGFEKDASSAYLRLFPGWGFEPTGVQTDLDASAVRALYFGGEVAGACALVPPAAATFLTSFAGRPAYTRLAQEHAAVEARRAELSAADLPLHEVRFVLEAGGQVQLNRRAGPIGAGLWELPGEVATPGAGWETVAAQWSERFSLNHLPAPATFDHPQRAQVARTVAHVYHLRLTDLPAGLATGGRPATLAQTQPERFHEDHAVILARTLGEGA